MAEYIIQGETLTSLADQIRILSGEEGAMTASSMKNNLQDVNSEVGDQADLIAQIVSTLDGKAGGSGGAQVAPTISIDSSGLITATAGTKSTTQQLAFQPAKTITPNIASQIAVSSGYYTGGNIIVAGDSNLVAGNIKSGVSIFGVTGTLTQGSGDSEAVFNDFIERKVAHVEHPTMTTVGAYAFYSFSSLATASFPACKSIGAYAFYTCKTLATTYFPVCTSISNYVFFGCSQLGTMSLPVCTSIGTYVFRNCLKLSALTLGASTVCAIANSSVFTNTPFTGNKTQFSGTPYIYVPASLVSAYQSATNWAYFSSRFSAMEV